MTTNGGRIPKPENCLSAAILSVSKRIKNIYIEREERDTAKHRKIARGIKT